MAKLFMSYCLNDAEFVRQVTCYMSMQAGLKVFFYSDAREPGTFRKLLLPRLRTSNYFIVFVGARIGEGQLEEIEWMLGKHKHKKMIVVALPKAKRFPLGIYGRFDPLRPLGKSDRWALACAKDIVGLLKIPFVIYDLPMGYLFKYEKEIIEEYVKGKGQPRLAKRMEGCPGRWPKVTHNTAILPNPVDVKLIGRRRTEKDQIVVDSRSQYHDPRGGKGACCLVKRELVFPEAGPREELRYPLPPSDGRPSSVLNVGVLVSGGIAPGINAVIAGIVDRHDLYRREQNRKHGDPPEGENREDYPLYTLSIRGYRDGFSGLLRGDATTLTPESVREHANQGGSLIGTSRCDTLLRMDDPRKREKALRRVVGNLASACIDILYVIGGDGSMSAAHALWTIAREMYPELSVVAVPKTMDNDILWVWQSFGFLSAVEKAKDFVLQLHTEAHSNPRLCIVQLFGSDSGFVVTHAALASGVCDVVLIPEVDFTIEQLWRHISGILHKRYIPGENGSSPDAMILAGETTIPLDARDYLRDKDVALDAGERAAIKAFLDADRRVRGQTPDALRTGGLKILARSLQKKIQALAGGDRESYWWDFRVFTNEPRHLIRAIDPSVQDVIFGQRLGSLAVDNAMAGYTDFMISQWLTEYVLVPLKLVVLGRKRVPRDGIFWKSVVASTGQPEDLVGDD